MQDSGLRCSWRRRDQEQKEEGPVEKEPFCWGRVCNLYPERSMEAVVDPTVEKEPQPREAEEEEKW